MIDIIQGLPSVSGILPSKDTIYIANKSKHYYPVYKLQTQTVSFFANFKTCQINMFLLFQLRYFLIVKLILIFDLAILLFTMLKGK